MNSFPKILLLADMGINLGFLGFLLVLIPSEVWGVNMDRWIFRPPPMLFLFFQWPQETQMSSSDGMEVVADHSPLAGWVFSGAEEVQFLGPL